jgi:hypothetical protein
MQVPDSWRYFTGARSEDRQDADVFNSVRDDSYTPGQRLGNRLAQNQLGRGFVLVGYEG